MLNAPLPRAAERLDSTHTQYFLQSGRSRPQAQTPLTLAVIVPTFNETANVRVLLDALDATLFGRRWEAVFVDDGSTDGTPELIEKIARDRHDIRLIRRIGRRGLSSAIVEGMLSTIAPVVAVIDADMQHDESILPALVDAIEDDRADVAVGTRYGLGGSTGTWTEARTRISAIGTRLAHMIVGCEISDPLSGFFAVRRSLVLEAAPHLSSVGFKILLDLVASAPGKVRIAETPYVFRCRHAGTSKLDATVSAEFVMLLLDKSIGRYVPPRLLMFLAVGMFGLVVNLAVLALALRLESSFEQAQILAVAVSIVSNFTLNNLLTYRDRQLRGRRWWAGLVSFAAICSVGAIAQIGFATLLYGSSRNWWLAGISGATIAAVWNYAASSFLTWKSR